MVHHIERLRSALEACADVIRGFDGGDPKHSTGWKHDELRDAWMMAREALDQSQPSAGHRGGPTEGDPNRPYCKPDQSCCDFCCGN